MGEPPVLFTADGCGDILAAQLRELVHSWPGTEAAESGAVTRGSVARVWLAVQCLPHACNSWEEVNSWRYIVLLESSAHTCSSVLGNASRLIIRRGRGGVGVGE